MTATDELRRLLDERGVEWTANDGEYVKETCWPYMGELMAAFAEYYDGTTRFACDTWCFTPAQAIDATLGPAYEPPIAAHWDGDVLVLTTPRDPSSVHVQRAEGQPRKVYPSEATLVAVTCKPVISDNLAASEGTGDAWADCSECGHLLYVLTDPGSEPPNYCPNCGRKVVE